MRIAQITYSTKPRGGVVHTLALAEALAARGHDVTVWTLGREGDASFFRPVSDQVKIRVVDFPAKEGEEVGERIQRSIDTMAEAFNPADYDIVHAQDCISANAVGPCVRTIHHLDSFTTPRLVQCHHRAVMEPIARICVSAAVAAEVSAEFGLNPTVISNGVDAGRFTSAAGPHGEAQRARWTSTLGSYVLALGGIEPRKGSLDLLEAFARISPRHPGLQLVFGGGETLFDYRHYREDFEARAAELGVQPKVLGVLSEEELPALVAAADVLGFVSTKEGFGLAAMEALAAGTPVLARDLPVIREVFGDTVTYASDVAGIAEEMSELINAPSDGDRRTKRTVAGRALAEQYTWTAAAAAHERFYTIILRTGGDHGQAIDLRSVQPAGL